MEFSAQQLCPHHNQPIASQIYYESKRKKRFCFFCQMNMEVCNHFCLSQDNSVVAKRLWELRYELSRAYAEGTYKYNPESKFPQMTTLVATDSDGVDGQPLNVIILEISTKDAELLVGEKKLTETPAKVFYLAMNSKESYVFTSGVIERVPKPHLLTINEENVYGPIPFITHGWRVK